MSSPNIAFAEIGVTTNFSFLRGSSHPQEYVAQAADYRMTAIGIADRNTLSGVVRGFAELENEKIPGPPPKYLVGSRLVFVDGTPDILAYPKDREAYGRLCRLITRGKLRAEKGDCILKLEDLLEFRFGMQLVLMPPAKWIEKTTELLEQIKNSNVGNVWLAATMSRQGNDRRRLEKLKALANRAAVPLIATSDALYHHPDRRPLQDVVTCIREKTSIERAGRLLESNAERHLKPGYEMARLFRNAPEAIAETIRFADGITFSLKELKYQYPDEPVPPGKTADQHLSDLVWEGARKLYPIGVTEKVEKNLKNELALISELECSHYFLTVHDIVRFARSQGILCQGRGSAANSSVCYVLGVTAADPDKTDLLFSRFLSRERKEPPDIDVDFEHERREEVMQYVFRRYGRHRAGIVATVIHYRPRSAIRDVGKALCLTEDVTAALANTVWGSWGSKIPEDHIRQAGLDPQNKVIKQAVAIATQLLDFPRHLSQHVGGFVLTQDRLDEMVPIGNAAMDNRTFIEWDKDDIDHLRMMKVDVLALGMLSCIRKAFDLLTKHKSLTDLTIEGIQRHDDPKVYDMLSRGDSLGVFQVESRAQMNMLPRLRPREFYDLVIEVAIVRPGPIQGNMVHPYLKRRKNPQLVTYPSPAPEHGRANELEGVLKRTLGVPIFQEQAMQLAITASKFDDAEANGLRRAMATFRNVGTIGNYKNMFIEGMVKRGYERGFAEDSFRQIEGFGSYGFPESHAVSFAILVYVSAWLKCHHPEVFCCAILNSQPMGFYTRASLVRDARENGVEVREADINFSGQDNILEHAGDKLVVRLGFRNIDGFQEKWEERIIEGRNHKGFLSLEDFAQRSKLPKKALLILADADCFRSIGLDRRAALWSARRLPNDETLPLFAALNEDEHPREQVKPLPVMPLPEHVVADYQTVGLSLKGHPMEFLRELFAREKVYSCRDAVNAKNGSYLRCAGAVLVRQRPGTAKGVVFMTIEDETGIANIVIWQNVFERYRKEVMGARLVMIEGRVQRAEGVTHIVADRFVDRSFEMNRLSDWKGYVPLSPVDEATRPTQDHRSTRRHPRNVRILPKSRDFH
jgi:error-prone DNA polymerase